MTQTVIKIENLSKQYRLGLVGTGTLSHDLNRWWAKVRGKEDPALRVGVANKLDSAEGDYVWALKDIHFEVAQGEVLGIIGKNGAGKSTLLKILSQVTGPTTGSVRIRGRIASLLEVGTGFHPELTGRENIFLNGAILGMSRKEIKSKLEEIVEFSGVDKYINTPVKRYSSGMKVRLAFAVAAHLEPEILVIDEVLAVGDAEFQRRCLGKMDQVAKSGRTVLFVSHNMSAVNNLCNSAIVLDKGKMVFEGNTDEAIESYIESSADTSTIQNPRVFIEDLDKPAQLMKVVICDKNGTLTNEFNYEDECHIILKFKVHTPNPAYYANIVVLDNLANKLFITTDEDFGESRLRSLQSGCCNYEVKLPCKLFKPGRYFLNIGVNSKGDGRVDKYDNIAFFEIVDNYSFRSMKNLYREKVVMAPEIKWGLLEEE